MSFLNYIPGVAHVKALTHLVCNDKEGAERTMETFHTKTPVVSHLIAGIAKVAGEDELAKKCWDGGNSSINALPVAGHVKGLCHYAVGDVEGGNKAMVDATGTTLNMADGIPVVGHTKGIVHYVCGDVDGGNKAMKAATRATVVMGAGAGGFLVGGPVGAVAGGVGAGAEWDLMTAALTDGKEVNGIAKIIDNPKNVDSYFDAGLSFVGDGMAGYSGGKMAEKITKPSGVSGGKSVVENANKGSDFQLDKAAKAQQLVNDLDSGKISWKEYTKQWDEMKPKGGFDNVPVKVGKDQLQVYYDRGLVSEAQFNRAMKEMAKDSSSRARTTVVLSGNNVPTTSSSATSDRSQQQPAERQSKKDTSNSASSNGNNNGQQQQQPPQQPRRDASANSAAQRERVLVLRVELVEIINAINRRIRQGGGSSVDRRFQREAFHRIHAIVGELFSNGYTAQIKLNSPQTLREISELVISSPDDSWRAVIEYQVVDYLDIHDQLIDHHDFSLDPASSCPTVLSAEFRQRSQFVLSRRAEHRGATNVIYGIRCRFKECRRNGISYVGQTIRNVHARVCGEHARSAAKEIGSGANSAEEAPYRPMYKHVAEHFENGDLPPDTEPRCAFRHVMDVILLPIGDDGKLRSWESFWQFFFHCRKFFFGWSQR